MYKVGDLVTLINDKSHGEGEDAIILKSGVCGLVMKANKKSDGQHQYVVDWGAYGQWYCYHNEIDGKDEEGWDDTVEEQSNWQVVANLEPEIERSDDGSIIGFTAISLFDEPSVVIDVDADIKRRMKEIEKGN